MDPTCLNITKAARGLATTSHAVSHYGAEVEGRGSGVETLNEAASERAAHLMGDGGSGFLQDDGAARGYPQVWALGRSQVG